MEIKPQTLTAAIQCLSTVVKELTDRLGADKASDTTELEQTLLAFELASIDLKKAYLIAREKYGGLPEYEELIEWSL